MYRFDINRTAALVRTGTLGDFFPSADTNIPQPLTAALATYIPARVVFFGGLPGNNRPIAAYRYNTMTATFHEDDATKSYYINQQTWKGDVTSAVMYYYPNNGSGASFVFNSSSVFQINPILKVSY